MRPPADGHPALVWLLGAESSGKTTLAADIAAAYRAQGLEVAVVGEALRDFVAAHGRAPTRDEQQPLAGAQTAAIRAALAQPGMALVLADTSAWMTAVYSEVYFDDASLFAAALDPPPDAILLTARDLRWQPDGTQRDGPARAAQVDARLRARLLAAGLPFAVIHGQGRARQAQALRALALALRSPAPGV